MVGRVGGKRRYPPSSAERLALVRLYQDAGFTLKEIRRLLAAGSGRRASWTPLAEHKIAELDARITEAQRAKNLLEHALVTTMAAPRAARRHGHASADIRGRPALEPARVVPAPRSPTGMLPGEPP